MKRYPNYKDSGIEWIGEIPEHWNAGKLKYEITRNEGGAWGDDFDNIGVIVLRSTEIDLDGNWKIEEPARRTLTDAEITKTHLQRGDLVITKSSGSEQHIGKTALVTEAVESINACFSNFMQRIRPNKNQESRYLHYILNSNLAREQYNHLSQTTTGLANLSAEIIGSLQIPFLAFPEQQTIANYLDRKTHLIDTLIGEKQKLIDLLKEQRSAIINQAVTKGLNPNVKLKDSGIEWLGEIPEHWDVKKLKYTIRLINEKVENGDKYELLIALENIEGFTGKLLNGSSSFEGSGNTFKKGDVLFNKLRPYLCKVVLTPQDGVAVGELLVFRPNDPINNRFLFYRILSTDFISIVNGSTYGAKMPRASWEFIRNLKIPLPPIIEQQSITDYLYKKTTRMDKSIEKQERQIDRLKEYRTALISEVVTGKIDVRDVGEQEDRHS